MSENARDWDDVSIADLGEIVGGGTPSRAMSSFWGGSIQWITPSEITALKGKFVRETRERITDEGLAASAAKLLPIGSILVTTRATLGEIAIAAVPVTTNQGFKNIIPNAKTDSLFAYYLVGMLCPEMERFASGTTFLEISKSDFMRIRAVRPRLREQQPIATILDALDNLIAKTEAVIEKIMQVRAGMVHDLLTRGFDENGLLRDPVAHPDQFKSTDLGLVPRSWRTVPLGACSELVTSGSRGWAAYYSQVGPLFLRIANLTRDSIDLRLEDVVRVTPPLGTEGARTEVRPGDILISITADLGIVGVIPEQFEGAYVNQHIALVRLTAGLCPRWVGRYLASGPASVAFRRFNDVGAKAGMNLPAIESLPIAIPPLNEQCFTTLVLDLIDVQIRKERSALKKIRELKVGLLTDLITGRVRIPESMQGGETEA
jgi:type I restriction enzyme S subunit